MRSTRLTQIAVVLLVFTGTQARYAAADVARITGTVTEVEARVRGSAIAVLDFEIPQLRDGVGLEVVTATIDWPHSGVSQSQTVRYRMFDTAGTGRLVPGGQSYTTDLAEVLSEEPVLEGVCYPQDYRRMGRGQLRMNVRSQVVGLVEVDGHHLQLIVATENMSPSGLAEAAEAPVLTIRYGFLGDLKEEMAHPE